GTAHWQADMGDQGELNPGDIAVLVRFKGLMPSLNQTLSRLGIPCSMPEKEAFWQEPRIKLILDSVGKMVGLAENQDQSLLQCPDRILTQGPAGLAAYLKDIPPFDMLFWQSSAFTELKKKYADQGGWVGLLNWIHLQSELEQVRLRAERVQIMTLHAAKGLEFEAVFLPALEDGILPFAGKGLLSGNLREHARMDEEEEKRLFYVGMTRAKSQLFLSCADRRGIYGKTHNFKPSRFLADMPKAAFKQTAMVARMVQKEKQLSLF
ncbi:MAG: 3'-5' exonuclease, partial [Desulfovibrionales bacterium]